MNFENDYLEENKPISVNLAENTKTTKQENNSEFIDNRPEAIEARKLQEMADNSPQAIEARKLQEMADSSPKILENQKMQELWQDIIEENQEQIQKASKIQTIFEKNKEASLPDLKNAMEKTPIAKNIEQQKHDGDHYSWCINKNTGEYEWVSCEQMQPHHIDVGAYKVVYDKECKTIYVYYKDNPTPIEELYMTMVTMKGKDGNTFKHYNDDRAAKFSMICAELGGSILKSDNPLHEALIISASIDNRLLVEQLDSEFKEKETFTKENLRQMHGDNTYQSLFSEKQYNAVKYPAYQDFEYGMNKRTSDETTQKVGLSTVYNAMDNPVYKLQSLGLEDAPEILGYAHSGNPALYKNKDIDFSNLETHKMSRVVGSEYLGKDLKEYHQKNNINLDKNGTMENYHPPTY